MFYENALGQKVAISTNSLEKDIIIMNDKGEMLIRKKNG